ncbi:MAG: hypothetical protein WD271_17095 [Acidimicrobiia bacterium]
MDHDGDRAGRLHNPMTVAAPAASSFGPSMLSAAAFVNRGFLRGLACGAVIGGLGGRLAMFVLRLTSDSSLHGLKTDDDFEIGKFSTDTIFLVLFTALLGGVFGILYLAIRGWLPERGRPALYGVFCGAVGGAIIVSPGGTDFTELSPLLLAIAFFVLIPAVYGVAVSAWMERSLRSGPVRVSGWRWLGFVPLLLLAFTGPFALVAVLVLVLVLLGNRSGRLLELWHSTVVTWLGRLAVTAVTVLSGVELVRDAAEIL